jgi:hypothetical protein
MGIRDRRHKISKRNTYLASRSITSSFCFSHLGCTAVDIGDLLRGWKPYLPDGTHGQALIEGTLGEDIRAEANQ